MSHSLVPRDPEALALMRLDRAALPQYLDRAQVYELIEACRRSHHGRDRLFVRVAWETGGRVSELIALRRCDTDIANRQIRLITLKRRTDRRRKVQQAARWIPVSPALCADLAQFFLDAELAGDARLFPISRVAAFKLISKAAKRAKLVARGGRDVSPHILRHSFAMNCLTQGMPITVLKDLLGHASIASTMVYLKTHPVTAKEFVSKVQF